MAGKDETISGGYVQTYATSKSGGIERPWQQHRPLVRGDSGHGMRLYTFDGRLMMILHRPFENARGKLYEMELAGQDLRVPRRRADLGGGGRRRAADGQDRSDRRDAPPVVDTFDHRPTCLYDQYRCSARVLTTGRAAPRVGGAGT